ncbi:MAG: hypothetical protein JWO26_340, partial [Rhodospirillales bacterium]|nr:hypothetical protein [Rhodospirillales bacterium]
MRMMEDVSAMALPCATNSAKHGGRQLDERALINAAQSALALSKRKLLSCADEVSDRDLEPAQAAVGFGASGDDLTCPSLSGHVLSRDSTRGHRHPTHSRLPESF